MGAQKRFFRPYDILVGKAYVISAVYFIFIWEKCTST